MQTSDELVNDLTTENKELDNVELKNMTDNYLSQLRMEHMIRQWGMPRAGKYNAARAQRAKARIAKRKSKR